MGKRGFGSKKWSPPNWRDFDGLCAIQCTKEEIASFYDTSEDSVERAVKNEHKQTFAVYFARKRKVGNISIRRALFREAQTGDIKAITLFYKKYLGYTDKTVVKVENASSQDDSAVAQAVARVNKLISDLAAQDKPTNKNKELALLAASLGLTN